MNDRNVFVPRIDPRSDEQRTSCSKPRNSARDGDAGIGEPTATSSNSAAAMATVARSSPVEDAGSMTRHEEFVAELEAYVTPNEQLHRKLPAEASVHISALRRGSLVNTNHPTPDSNDRVLENKAELARARLVFAATLAVPLVLISLSTRLFGSQFDHAMLSLLRFSEFLLASHLAIIAGAAIYRRAWRGLRNFTPNKHLVYGLGVLVAYGFGVVAFSSTDVLSAPFFGGMESASFNFLIAGLLVAVAQFGEWFWTRTECTVRKAIASLRLVWSEFRRRGVHVPKRTMWCHSNALDL
jgi:cation transport ATPase